MQKEKKPLLFVVSAALIDEQNRFLLTQRPGSKPMAGLWEFPGGKLEPFETPEEAIVRELYEELDVVVDQEDLIPLTFASHSYADFHLFMPIYICRKWKGQMYGKEGQEIIFCNEKQMKNFDFPQADIMILQCLIDKLKGKEI